MDLKLTNGYYEPGTYQGAATIRGLDELGQRVVMKLSAPRGRFVLRPDYGSRLHLLVREKKSARESAAALYVKEALQDEPDLWLESVRVTEPEPGRLRVDAELQYLGEELYVSTFVRE